MSLMSLYTSLPLANAAVELSWVHLCQKPQHRGGPDPSYWPSLGPHKGFVPFDSLCSVFSLNVSLLSFTRMWIAAAHSSLGRKPGINH